MDTNFLFKDFRWCLNFFVFFANLAGILFFSWLFSLKLLMFFLPTMCLLLAFLFLFLFTFTKRGYLNRFCWIFPLIYAVFIFFLSHNSFENIKTVKGTDYFHIVEFFSLGLLCSACFIKEKNFRKLFFKVLIVGILYAFFDEIHQYFVPNRNCSFMDVIFDSGGILVSLLIIYPLYKKVVKNG